MKPIIILYATREGHTQKIAERVAAEFDHLGLPAEMQDLREAGESVKLQQYAGVVLAASVHRGKHEREMVRFVREHRAELENMPAAFLSITLSEAGVERTDAGSGEHAQFVAGVEKVLEQFFSDTGWRPTFVKPIAGALLYSKYGFFMRLVMRNIAKKSGGDTDSSRDYEYTNWPALDRFVEDFAAVLPRAVGRS